jgi:hypothetical protein
MERLALFRAEPGAAPPSPGTRRPVAALSKLAVYPLG